MTSTCSAGVMFTLKRLDDYLVLEYPTCRVGCEGGLRPCVDLLSDVHTRLLNKLTSPKDAAPAPFATSRSPSFRAPWPAMAHDLLSSFAGWVFDAIRLRQGQSNPRSHLPSLTSDDDENEQKLAEVKTGDGPK